MDIHCGQCGKDITYSTNSIDYRILLKNDEMTGDGAVTDMLIYPPLDEDKYFCGFACLKLWVNRFKGYSMKENVNFQTSPGFIEEKEPLIVCEFEGDVCIRIDGSWGTKDYIANIRKNEEIRISIIKKDEVK